MSKIFKLSNGETIPAIGLGTWELKGNDVKKPIEYAFKAGKAERNFNPLVTDILTQL
jgi:diketogulonate reductase-like aldo/keto reductase